MTQGLTIWLTGLSGAGKTTTSRRLAEVLRAQGRSVEVLDGDEIREQLSKDLGFSRDDRNTNIRRITFVTRLLTRHGVTVIVAAISPYQETRDEARALLSPFVEVYLRCSVGELMRRDVKGLYAKALRGEIAQFTGVSDPYEAPRTPEVVVDTDVESPDETRDHILTYLEAAGHLSPPGAGGTDTT